MDLNTAKLEVTVVVEDSAEEKVVEEREGVVRVVVDSAEAAMDWVEAEKATGVVDSAVAMDLEEDTTSRHIRTQYR